MEFLTEYGLFLAKIVTVLLALGIAIGLISGATKSKSKDKGRLEVTSLNDKFKKMEEFVRESVAPPHLRKAAKKASKKAAKSAAKKASKSVGDDKKARVFVLDFHGDLRASAAKALREEITAVLAQIDADDEIVVRLESSGGTVHGYGLAASQLDRIRKRQISLTVCIDKVAASGGYMMACVGGKILAAPFAIIGSIGVVAQIPNINRLLKRHDIDIELVTAGKYKRTLTVLGENTDEGREKFREDLEEVHDLFKKYVAERRQHLDIEKIATGEIWYGTRAEQLGLVDDIKTSDEYLTTLANDHDVYAVRYIEKRTLPEKIGFAAEETSDRFILRWLGRMWHPDRYS